MVFAIAAGASRQRDCRARRRPICGGFSEWGNSSNYLRKQLIVEIGAKSWRLRLTNDNQGNNGKKRAGRAGGFIQRPPGRVFFKPLFGGKGPPGPFFYCFY